MNEREQQTDQKGLFTFYRELQDYEEELQKKNKKVINKKIKKMTQKFKTQPSQVFLQPINNSENYKSFLKNIIKQKQKMVSQEESLKLIQSQLLRKSTGKGLRFLTAKKIQVTCAPSSTTETIIQEFPKKRMHINYVNSEIKRKEDSNRSQNIQYEKSQHQYSNVDQKINKSFFQKIHMIEVNEKKKIIDKHEIQVPIYKRKAVNKSNKGLKQITKSHKFFSLESKLPDINRINDKHKTEQNVQEQDEKLSKTKENYLLDMKVADNRSKISLSEPYKYPFKDILQKSQRVVAKIDLGVKESVKNRSKQWQAQRKFVKVKLGYKL